MINFSFVKILNQISDIQTIFVKIIDNKEQGIFDKYHKFKTTKVRVVYQKKKIKTPELKGFCLPYDFSKKLQTKKDI